MLINNKQFKPFYAVFILAGFFLFCMGNHDRLSALTNDNGKSDSKDHTKIELTIAYPYGYLFKTALEDKIAPEFMAVHPNIKVTFEPPYKNYEEGTNRILDQAGTNKLPDISFQGINRQRILVTHKLAVPLDNFISHDTGWKGRGVNPEMVGICKFGKEIYGLPFAISMPIIYYNADLVSKAGGNPDNFPDNWEGILKLGSKMDALDPNIYGLIYDYEITGNWLFQALIFSKGGEMTSPDEKKVAFAGERGRWAMQLFDRMVKEGGMPGIPSFRKNKWYHEMMFKGRVGILVSSTGGLGYFQKKIGKQFGLRTAVFPDVVSEIGKLPVGGNVAMMLTKDSLKQKAAWKFIRFVTSPRGQTIQVKNAGYMPSNFLAVKNPALLGRYYEKNLLRQTTIAQLLLVKKWYAFPGPDALKITKVIEKHIRSVVTQEVDPDTAHKKMVEEVEALLPK
jgi:multiple sugar transport system substrate-binding protein